MTITCVRLKPLHPNISIHILHTVLCTFPKVLTRRISLTINSIFCCGLFPLFSWPPRVIQRWYCKEKLDVSQSWGGGGKGLILINPSGWGGDLMVNFFPINDNTSIIRLKLLVWSESKHFTCSFFSRFKIKSFWFANSVQFVTYTINYRDAYRQYLSASCWLVFQNINCSLSSAPHRPWIAVLRVIRQKYLERNPGLVKYNDTSKLKLSNKQVMVILKLVR